MRLRAPIRQQGVRASRWTKTLQIVYFDSAAQAAAYLAGMIDGEGHIHGGPSRITGREGGRSIAVSNTDWDLISATASACHVLGVTFSIYFKEGTGREQDKWDLRIHGRENLEAIARTVPLQASRKKERLAFLLASYRLRIIRPPVEELAELYRFSSLIDLARHYRVGAKTIVRWLAFYGIHKRDQREALVLSGAQGKHYPSKGLPNGLFCLRCSGDLTGIQRKFCSRLCLSRFHHHVRQAA